MREKIITLENYLKLYLKTNFIIEIPEVSEKFFDPTLGCLLNTFDRIVMVVGPMNGDGNVGPMNQNSHFRQRNHHFKS